MTEPERPVCGQCGRPFAEDETLVWLLQGTAVWDAQYVPLHRRCANARMAQRVEALKRRSQDEE